MYTIAAASGAACVAGFIYLHAWIKRRIAKPYGKAIAELRTYYEADREDEQRLYESLMRDLGGEG